MKKTVRQEAGRKRGQGLTLKGLGGLGDGGEGRGQAGVSTLQASAGAVGIQGCPLRFLQKPSAVGSAVPSFRGDSSHVIANWCCHVVTQLPAHYPAHVASERHILTLRGFTRPQRGQCRLGPRGAGREKPRLARDLLRVVLAPPGRSGPFEWVPSGCGGRICSVPAQPGGGGDVSVRARGAQRLQGHEGRRALGRAPAPGAPHHLTFARRHRQQLGDASKPRVPALRRDSVWGRGLPPRPRWSRLRINERGQPGARGPPPLPHVLVSWWPFPSTAELQGSRFAWSFLSLPNVSKSRSASV